MLKVTSDESMQLSTNILDVIIIEIQTVVVCKIKSMHRWLFFN